MTAPGLTPVPGLPDPATVRRAAPVAPRTGWTSVMGQSSLTPLELAAWFRAQGKRERTSVPVTEIARLFVEEGRAQGVRGDIAFAQAIVETGWFGYAGSMVSARDNNFSGLGACDRCRAGNRFASARVGVRAQIQHLAAYADPYADTRLARPLADGRFSKVSPLGKAPYWEMMGGGNWATARGYGRQVLGLWREALAFSAVTRPAPSPPPAPPPATVTVPAPRAR
ncbi:MAG: glucosaminidase domain-containing protein [Thermoleophilia bacterium]|nr:glucosaminidase domain-containing protein [Thermoleophilia bacterium]